MSFGVNESVDAVSSLTGFIDLFPLWIVLMFLVPLLMIVHNIIRSLFREEPKPKPILIKGDFEPAQYRTREKKEEELPTWKQIIKRILTWGM